MRHSLNSYCSYLALSNAQYWIFRHPFLRHLAFPYFWSDSIINLYANSKRVEVVWCEVSWGYAALIEIYDLLIVVPFYIYFCCQATSVFRMLSMMWQENNKMKQKEVILFNKGSWIRRMSAKPLSVRSVRCQKYGQACDIKCL